MLSSTGGAVFARVALFARAWIEIIFFDEIQPENNVALFARAWIEIKDYRYEFFTTDVALFARAWIEINFSH